MKRRMIAIALGLAFGMAASRAGADGPVVEWPVPPPPATTPPAGLAAQAVAVGQAGICAIKANDHTVVCWNGLESPVSGSGYVSSVSVAQYACALPGANCWGDLGPNARLAPLIETSRALALGVDFACGIEASTNAVWCLGYLPPAPVGLVASSISAAGDHVCAIQSGSGAVVCWGYDHYGETFPPDAVNGTAGSASSIATGGAHSCAVQAGSGAVVCWGRNQEGQASPPSAVSGADGTADSVVAGDSHACALQRGTHRVVCWGSDGFHQLDVPESLDGVRGSASAIAAGSNVACAIQTGSMKVICWGGEPGPRHVPPPDSLNGRAGIAGAIAAGTSQRACAIQSGTGAVICWGDEGAISPPDSVNGVEGGASALAMSGLETCAIQSETGALVCWDRYRMLSLPDANGAAGPFSAISLSWQPYVGKCWLCFDSVNDCAIRAGSGAVTCWGHLDLESSTLVPPPQPPASLVASAVATGVGFGCAIRAGSGAVVCWGPDTFAAPDLVDGTAGTATAIAAGWNHACAIQAETRGVVCWGFVEPPPSSVSAEEGGARAIYAFQMQTCAIRARDGGIVCWPRTVDQPPASLDGSAGSATAVAIGEGVALAIQAPDLDLDQVADDYDNCPDLWNSDQADADGDGVGDRCDNCVDVANARVSADYLATHPWATLTGGQRDDDHDGRGNRCDAVELADLRASIGRPRALDACGTTHASPCAIYDLDESGVVIGSGDLFWDRALLDGNPGEGCPRCPLACESGPQGSCD